MKEHKKIREMIQLFFADELASDQSNVLHEHLAGCQECRAEYDELKRIITLLGDRGAGEPSEQLLWEARQDLRETLRRETMADSILTRLTQGVTPSSPPSPSSLVLGWLNPFRLALSGAAAIAIGVFIGYLAFARVAPSENASQFDSGLASSDIGGTDIANVRFVDWNEGDRQIELAYDLVRPVRLRTDVADDRVQRVLARALLTEDNPGVRLRAIDALEAHSTRTSGPDVKLALIDALKTDPNAGVRSEALRVLGNLPFDDEIKQACLYVLENDANAGMRVASINLLSGAKLAGYKMGQDVYNFLTTTLNREDDPLLRARSTVFIEEVTNE